MKLFKPAPTVSVRPLDIYSTTIVLAFVLAPFLFYLTPWVPIFTLLLGAWRIYLLRSRQKLPGVKLLMPVAVAGLAAIIISYQGMFGRDASVSLLTLMMGMKLLEAHCSRDLRLLSFLGFFLTMTAFLFSQSIFMGLYVILVILLLVSNLLRLSHPNGTLSYQATLKRSAWLLAQAAPLMLIMFILFPRVPGPLWGVPQDATRGMTGLSETMSPGSISALSQSDAIAFRADFKGGIPSAKSLYWRGPILWHFDGRTWEAGDNAQSLPEESLTGDAQPLLYTVTLEPHNLLWLFMLDMPTVAPPNATLTHDYQLRALQPIRSRTRYSAQSVTQYHLGIELDAHGRQAALQLPRGYNPKTIALGQQWAESGMQAEQIAAQALNMFRQEKFQYTLRPGLLGQNSVDEFLFVSKKGFCEHYAGAFVYLMRAAGIPARVVTGYQGGEINAIGHYLIVRQADAHAWAEIWLSNKGWVRIDPTAAVSPSRIESGLAAMPAGEPIPAMMRNNMQWLKNIRLGWDTLNNGWNQWVLGYNEQKQLDLLSRLAGGIVSWQDMVITLMVGVSIILLGLTAALLRKQRKKLDALEKAYQKFVAKLNKMGLKPQHHEGAVAFGERAALALPEHANVIRLISQEYNRLRYGRLNTTQATQTFEQKVHQFRL